MLYNVLPPCIHIKMCLNVTLAVIDVSADVCDILNKLISNWLHLI